MSILLNALFCFGDLGFKKTGVGFSMNMEDLGFGIALWDFMHLQLFTERLAVFERDRYGVELHICCLQTSMMLLSMPLRCSFEAYLR